jgi:hypothetical protein
MAWTLEKLRTQPTNLNVPMRPTVGGVADKGSGWDLTTGGATYQVRYYSKGGAGADGSATIGDNQGASLNVTCNGGATEPKVAYLLPWATDKVYVTDLAARHDYFFTAKLNGCAIFVSGGVCNPTVVHANASAVIPVPPDFSSASTQLLINAYSGAYNAISAALVQHGDLDQANLAVFRPGLSGYIGDAAVFGVRNAARWAFYAVIGSTKNPPIVKIWPN